MTAKIVFFSELLFVFAKNVDGMLFNHCLNSQYESVSILTKSYLKCVGGAVQQNLLYGDLLRAFGFFCRLLHHAE